MKKVSVTILIIALVMCILIVPASAYNKFTYCGHCGGNGKCPTCNGEGGWTCTRCGGKGWVTCQNCNGAGCNLCTYEENGVRTYDGRAICNGCTVTPGKATCHNCNGSGKCEDCKGTGYMVKPVVGVISDPYIAADGIQNQPKVGDEIYNSVGGKDTLIYIYGVGPVSGSSSDTGSSKNNDNKVEEVSEEETTEKNQAMEIPDDRSKDINFRTSNENASGAVFVNQMSTAQKRYYEKLSDEQLTEVLESVQGIISTAQVGQISDESKSAYQEFLDANKMDESKVVPISFEGHYEIGFPVHVSVKIESGILDATDVHVFHISEDGTINQIPDDNIGWITSEEDGSLIQIEFDTDSFSDFLATNENNLIIPEKRQGNDNVSKKVANANQNKLIIIVVISTMVLCVLFAALIIFKKRANAKDSL